MGQLCTFYKSTIGKKIVVAITGTALLVFVIGHMLGNLKAFMGYAPDGVHHLDHYAEFLRSFMEDAMGHGTFLWITRIGLLVCLIVHVATVAQLQVLNRKAKPVKYQVADHRAVTLAAQTMWWGGLMILLFVVFHILHLTTGTLHSSFIEGQVYRNVYAAFSNPILVLIYFLAMTAVASHLYHGIWSLFQTLGLDNPDRNECLRRVARFGSILLAAGFLLVPLAVLFGGLPAPK